MARSKAAAYGLAGTFVLFLVVIAVLPQVKYFFPQVSAFEDMSCEQGSRPCPEGYFCEQRTCVPILPRQDVNAVVPNSQ